MKALEARSESGAEREQELIYRKTRERRTITRVLRRLSLSPTLSPPSPRCPPLFFPSFSVPPVDKMLINVKLSSLSFPALNALMRIRLPSRLQAAFSPPTHYGQGEAKGVQSVDKRHSRLTCKVRLYIEQQINGWN